MRPPRPWAFAAGDGLALILGALLPLAFAPFGFWLLAVVLPAGLLWLWEGITPRRAAWRGWLFGLGLHGVGVSWIYISLHRYGHAPAAFAALTTLLLILYLALYPAAVGWLLGRFFPRPGPVRYLLAAPALWTLLEWVRSWLLSGFPWLSPGYSQIDSPLRGLAPLLGVFGVGWALLLSAGLLLILMRGRQWRWGALLALLWAGGWGLDQIPWTRPAGAPLRVALVQGNIDQNQKFQSGQVQRTLGLYLELSDGVPRPDLIIWPETAVPVYYDNAVDGFFAPLAQRARQAGVDYLIGVPAGSRDSGVFHNAVVSVGSAHGFYHKRRLVPFGEYLPLRWLLMFFRDFVDIPLGDFTAGGVDQPLLQAAGQPLGMSICFEAVFGSEIRRSLPAARLLVNVSNDAWFGDSLAPHQHLEINRMRALEAGRWLARATNTGITALIDQRGRIVVRGGQFVATVVEGNLQPRRGATPYVRFGDAPVVALAGLGLGLAFYLSLSRWRQVT
ncbi:MAG: apolipoprotein N-acyltransferase [Pseudomonadota bacterium]|nr:apolipoprotein N-acyltransferase [Pseudomonadota bacterium]